MEIVFNPSRLRFARERRGMTKVELAGAVGISPRLLSMYENDHVESPPQQTLEMIVDVLGFPLEFLKGDNIEPLDKDNVSFRSHSKMTFKQAKSAIGASVIALSLADGLASVLTFQKPIFLT